MKNDKDYLWDDRAASLGSLLDCEDCTEWTNAVWQAYEGAQGCIPTHELAREVALIYWATLTGESP